MCDSEFSDRSSDLAILEASERITSEKGAMVMAASSASRKSAYQDITNYAFVDSATGRELTVTAGQKKIAQSGIFESAWGHLRAAVALLRATEMNLGESVRYDDGRTILIVSYTVTDDGLSKRVHFGIARMSSGQAVSVRMTAEHGDASAVEDLKSILREATPVALSRSPAIEAHSVEEEGRRTERIGSFRVSLPGTSVLLGNRRYLSGDGTKRIDIDFRDEPVLSAGPVPMGTQPEISPHSQFVRIRTVPRFLRSPIRYEESNFEAVGPEPGAVAFGLPEGDHERHDEERPAFLTEVSILGRPAEVRFFGESTKKNAQAETREFLNSIEKSD